MQTIIDLRSWRLYAAFMIENNTIERVKKTVNVLRENNPGCNFEIVFNSINGGVYEVYIQLKTPKFVTTC